MINLIFLTVISWSNPALPTDSLRTETINGKVFIIHQVGERETLYAISKRYGTPIMAILEFNSTAGSGLEIGQILKIPYTPKSKVQTSQGSVHKVAAKETLYSVARLYGVSVDDIKTWNNLKDNALSMGQELIIRKKAVTTETVESQTVKAPPGFHKVEAKETLFFISRKYGVTIQQLKDWNHIEGNDVKVGSLLIVSATPGTTTPSNTSTTSAIATNSNNPSKDPANSTNPNSPGNLTSTNPTSTNPTNPIFTNPTNLSTNPTNPTNLSINISGSDEVKEGGLAELIEGTEGNRKYLGLHRTAKAGTILKVRNELNNREVFVRIVGPLPPTGVNDNIVIKISKSAFDRLGAIDPKFRVEVTYYK